MLRRPPPTDASAATMSAADRKRAAGSFMRHRSIAAASASGMSWRVARTLPNGLSRIRAIVASADDDSNGCVPVAYSWPAGSKGLIRGYTYDHDSSEFTVYHLKQMLHALADMLARQNEVEFERDGVRFNVHVADEVDFKVELEVETDERELEIELTW